MRLRGATAVVTGGGSGLGEALAANARGEHAIGPSVQWASLPW